MNEELDLIEVGQVWYVQGDPGQLYATKEDAEIAARIIYPDETASQRYSRIFYRPINKWSKHNA